MGKKNRRFTGKNKIGKRGLAVSEDAEARSKAAFVGGINNLRKGHDSEVAKFTNAKVDKRLEQMAASRELTKGSFKAMPMPIDEVAWRQANNLMPVENAGAMQAFPFLILPSVVHKAKNRLLPPHEEANYTLTMVKFHAKTSKGHPKQLLSKKQKEAHELRVQRNGAGI